MGSRKVIVKKSAAENIAAVAWFIESKGIVDLLKNLQMLFMISSWRYRIHENLTLYAKNLSVRY